MKLYFDTTTWVRLFETGNQRITDERVAIRRICCTPGIQIITSRFQIDQMYYKKNDPSISPKQKQAFEKAISICETAAPPPPQFDPYYYYHLRDFSNRTNLQHREDRIHIVLAWLNEAKFFITTDGELYNSEKSSIEVALAGMFHPNARNNFHSMKVLNPVAVR